MKIDSIGWVFQFGIFINQEALILLISWKTRLKSAVLILTALFSLFCRINKLEQWNNIVFNLCNITYLYKLLNLNYNNFLPNTSHFKIICYFWSVKSGSTISRKRKIISYSFNISKNKNPGKFCVLWSKNCCAFFYGHPIHFYIYLNFI